MPNKRTRGYIDNDPWDLHESEWRYWLGVFFGQLTMMLIFISLSPKPFPITFESYQHKTTQAKVFELLNEQLTVRDADKMMALIQAESGFNQFALHANKDGSIDRGILQISNKYHKEISDECAFSISCSIKASIEIIKKRGYKEWCAGKYLGLDK